MSKEIHEKKEKSKEELLKKLDEVYSYIRDTIESEAFLNGDVDLFLDDVVSMCANMDREYDIVYDPDGYETGYNKTTHVISDFGVDKLKMISSRR